MGLSQRRAAIVRQKLVDAGIDPARLLAKGHGAGNERIDLEILQQDPPRDAGP